MKARDENISLGIGKTDKATEIAKTNLTPQTWKPVGKQDDFIF